MHHAAASFLVHPASGAPLALKVFSGSGDWVDEGVLRAGNGDWFPIVDGLPVFPSAALDIDLTVFAKRHGLPYAGHGGSDHKGQAHTNVTFSDKWRRFKNYGLEPEHKPFLQGWYVKKFGLSSTDELPGFFSRFENILEAGPGSGFNSRFMAQHCKGSVFALDISEAARTTMGNTRDLGNCHAVNADLFHSPFPDGAFDFVIADGVLHHTPSTRGAMEALYRKVKPGGQFFFYVYRKMGAARVFVDAHIREAFMKLEPEACYAACEGITELGRELSRLKATVTLEKPIDVLGIPAGTHDVQRLIYYNFMKCFWNDAFDYETNNMVNFDWYHPHHAWQQTDDEVIGWLKDIGVTEFALNDSNPNGISVLLRKPG
jgi:SAM-dependent methyltransferase